jgi:hypothetical protein
MNCAKCAGLHGGRKPAQFAFGLQIQLVKVGEVGDCDKYRCPRCRAVFFFTKGRKYSAPALALQPA